MDEPLYQIRFGYAKPATLPIKMEQKLAKISFYVPASVRKNTNIVIPARVPIEIYKNFLLKNGWVHKDDRFFTPKEEAYYKAVILASVFQSARERHLMSEIYRLVEELPYIDLKYWSNVFVKAYDERKKRRDLYKPARLFKEVYGYA